MFSLSTCACWYQCRRMLHLRTPLFEVLGMLAALASVPTLLAIVVAPRALIFPEGPVKVPLFGIRAQEPCHIWYGVWALIPLWHPNIGNPPVSTYHHHNSPTSGSWLETLSLGSSCRERVALQGWQLVRIVPAGASSIHQ